MPRDYDAGARSVSARSPKIGHSSRTCGFALSGRDRESREDPIRPFHSGKKRWLFHQCLLGVTLLPLAQARRPDHLLAYDSG
ncbi:hypothetical protein EVAR_71953_1 [Eumeta japonica]|uniref:Uncharacterized protein n=1 Tax=Eumeta variegata TaxID=151549 RepID=A0A4C1STU3_EUMVA|nr:hypothetical protein EVAR_71953_1 [Eumeta japonica]